MFDDFSPSSLNRQAGQRFRRSMLAACVVYGSSGAAIVGATATVHKVVEDNETQVEFAPPPPEPPPPPPPVEAAPPPPSPRPKVKRPELAPPDEVPKDKPDESDKPLAEAGQAGPQDGFLDGVEGGTGTAPAPKPPPPPPPPPRVEALVPAVMVGGSDKPKYSASARRKGIEGSVVVSFEVLEDGRVTNLQIVSGPEELRESVLKSAAEWRFRPARRGAVAVRYRMKKTVVFRLEDA
jgi:protein TonB